MRFARLRWLLMVGILAGACGGDPEVEETTAVVRVEVSPEEAVIELNGEVTLEARAFNGKGNPVPGAKFTFTSSAPDVATVDAQGVVRGIRPGAAMITAAVGSKRATMEVTVRPSVHSISIHPDPVEMETTDTVQLEATAYDESGNPIEGSVFEWEVENDAVATVDEEGRLTAKRREETTEVIARSRGVEGRAKVIVRKKVDSIEIRPSKPTVREKKEIQLLALVRDDGGTILSGREVAWESADESIATIDPDGVVRGIKAGSVEIAASSGGVVATTTVEVLPERVDRLVIEPEAVEVEVGETQQFTVRAFNDEGEELFGRPLVWKVVDLDLQDQSYAAIAAKVDEDGLLVAQRPLNGRLDVSVPGDGITVSASLLIILRMEGVSAGQHHSCGLTAGGQAWCWGDRADGRTGRPASDDLIPAPVDTDLRFRALAAGANHSCGLTALGVAYCWGANDHGQLGDGTNEGSMHPVEVARVTGQPPFTKIYAGDGYSCAIDDEGAAWCWGLNQDGRLGNAQTVSLSIPVKVAGESDGEGGEIPIVFRELALGSYPDARKTFTCGVSTSNVAYCWGENDLTSHGIGGGAGALFRASPVRVAGGHAFRSVSVGARHACGLTLDGEAYCWGRGGSGELGDAFGDETEDWQETVNHHRLEPHPVATDLRFELLGAGLDQSCALTAEGELYCWGHTGITLDFRWTPVKMGGSDWRFETISSGYRHFCGIDPENVVYCWGDNKDQQLGNPSLPNWVSTPTRIFPE